MIRYTGYRTEHGKKKEIFNLKFVLDENRI